MSRNLTPIDISNIPDLVRLVKEVNTAKQPRILKQDSEPVAMLMPMKTAAERHKALEVFDYQPLKVLRKRFLDAGYPEAEVNDMLEALSELSQYADTDIRKSP